MKLKNNKYASISRDGKVYSNLFGKWQEVLDSDFRNIVYNLVKVYRKRTFTKEQKEAYFDKTMDRIKEILDSRAEKSLDDIKEEITIEEEKVIDYNNETFVKTTLSRLINFFTEFEFEPNFRFVNSLGHACKNHEHKDFINNYFELTDNNYITAINEKMNSYEFKEIIEDLSKINISKKINNRFKLYYGSQGTGKTTIAMKEANNNVMVCHSAMLPSDLMEDFKFEDGKANFKPSVLQDAIVNGKTIVLDEINLLPFESLRFLQSLLDGKKQFSYKGNVIEIKDGFKIIGTMNLYVNGAIYALPEPLVDRCEEIKKYKLTAEQLVGALI